MTNLLNYQIHPLFEPILPIGNVIIFMPHIKNERNNPTRNLIWNYEACSIQQKKYPMRKPLYGTLKDSKVLPLSQNFLKLKIGIMYTVQNI